MGLRETLEQLLAADDAAGADANDDGSDGTIIYECRNCGTAVAADATTCPNCGAEEIAAYAIE